MKTFSRGQLRIVFEAWRISYIPQVQEEVTAVEKYLEFLDLYQFTEEKDMEQPARATGTVKWYNEKKGYGFITAHDGGEIFVHFTNLNGQVLHPGDKVEFDVVATSKGSKAVDVVVS